MINHRLLCTLHFLISPSDLTRVMGAAERPESELSPFRFSLSQLVPGFMVFSWPIKPATFKQIFQNLQQ